MNIRVLVDPPSFNQPFRSFAIQVTPNIIIFSSSGGLVESEKVMPTLEILDVPLQIGVVNRGRITETWTHNLALRNNDRQLLMTINRNTNKLSVSDVGNKVWTTR